jgi:subtilisin family serine protease
MRKFRAFPAVAVTFVLLSLAHAENYVPATVIVDIKHAYLPITPTPNGQSIIMIDIPSIDSLNVQYEVYSFEKMYKGAWTAVKGYYLLSFPDTFDVTQVASAYSNDLHILAASPDFPIEFDVTPVDSFYPQQWGHLNMNSSSAWRHTNGHPNVVIQIIDQCVDYGHPDLVHNMWQNTGAWPYGEDVDGDGRTIEWSEADSQWVLDPGDFNNWDDDNNGYRDDLVGWNFAGNQSNPDPNPNTACADLPPSQGGDHGDHTAGTAAAVTNNNISAEEAAHVCDNWTGTTAGTAWFCKIMAARISGYRISEAIDAIAYGVDKGARIINMSFSHSEDWATFRNAINAAWDAGLLLVGSAGNYGSEQPRYPAAYENVIGVAATDPSDVKFTDSNYGTWVSLCAPGENWSPGREFGHWFRYCYSEMGGTSIAAPFVAGVAALVWSCNLDATNTEVRAAIETTAVDICDLPGNQGQPWCYPFNRLGHGRVNALEAVKEFRPVPPPPGDCNCDFTVSAGDVVYLISYIYRAGSPPDPLCVADVKDDDVIDAADVVYLISYLYQGGPPPLDGCD